MGSSSGSAVDGGEAAVSGALGAAVGGEVAVVHQVPELPKLPGC